MVFMYQLSLCEVLWPHEQLALGALVQGCSAR
jgi:hypothetical protein